MPISVPPSRYGLAGMTKKTNHDDVEEMGDRPMVARSGFLLVLLMVVANITQGDPDSPQSMHEIWDVITRNTQVPVSGIYYYSVESEYGNQVGKIVIIM